MQPTPLRGPRIAAILRPGIGPTVFPIYTAARLMGNPFDQPFSDWGRKTQGYPSSVQFGFAMACTYDCSSEHM
jgi:hypothetical protein